MRDKNLIILLALLIVLSLGHDADHIVRGDFGSRLAGMVPLILAGVAKYAILGAGLFLYVRNKLGALIWAILAGIGVALGWLAHFSPFTEQTPQYIYRAYETPAAGALAVAWLVALMLALITTAIYAEYLWARGMK